MENEEYYGVFKKEVIEDLKIEIANILDGKIAEEDEKIEVLKKVSNLKVAMDGIKENSTPLSFDKIEFQKELKFDELIQKEAQLWERVKRFGRD